jgi:hypothetical protein
MNQAFRHLGEHSVPDTVTKGIVHYLEAVKVEIEDGEHSSAAAQTTESLVQAIHQDCAISQAGQGIGSGLTFEGDRVQLTIGYISHHRHDELSVCAVYASGSRFDGACGAVTAPKSVTRRGVFYFD